MREILFRGKRFDNGEWVEGDLIQGVGHKDGKMFILPIIKNLSYLEGYDHLDSYQVIPESVGQFTGMVDKKGVKIFEDDILQGVSNDVFSYEKICKYYHVRWGVDSWHIMHTRLSMQELFIYCNKNIEVIGNIHDKNY